ncbi:uncharacterized protein [Argopecten irradians]|uniref:uncharacterized protein n=1 Tax=Argopecten irradians TaxID=31199 RepID=UPI003716BCB4
MSLSLLGVLRRDSHQTDFSGFRLLAFACEYHIEPPISDSQGKVSSKAISDPKVKIWDLGATPIRLHPLQVHLEDNPLRVEGVELAKGFEFGFRLEYLGPRIPLDCTNLKSAVDHQAALAEEIESEVRLTKALTEDLEVLLQLVSSFNGVCFIPDKDWTTNTALELYTDSAAYIGCFIDNSNRILNGKQQNDHQLTIGRCIEICVQDQYVYAGAQYRTQCFCGNSIDMTKQTDEDQCSTRCAGNSDDICGGTWRMSVYTTDPVTTTAEILTTTLAEATTTNIQTTTQAETTTTDIQTTTPAETTTTNIQTTTQAETTTTNIQTTTPAETTTTNIPTTSEHDVTSTATQSESTTQTTAQTTTVRTNSTSEAGNHSCRSICCFKYFNLTETEQVEILKELTAQLKVAKRSTSTFRRRFTSDYDPRPSSFTIGISAVTVLSLVVGFIVVPDTVKLLHYLYRVLCSW